MFLLTTCSLFDPVPSSHTRPNIRSPHSFDFILPVSSQLGFSDGWFWFVCICIMNVICMLRGRPYHENGCVGCLCVCVCVFMHGHTCVLACVCRILSTCKLHVLYTNGPSQGAVYFAVYTLSLWRVCIYVCVSMFGRIVLLCVAHVGHQCSNRRCYRSAMYRLEEWKTRDSLLNPTILLYTPTPPSPVCPPLPHGKSQSCHHLRC